MPQPVLPLQDLTQQITQHQSHLERLRREYEARQAKLAKLTRQKETLQGRIQQVEAKIQAVTQGSPAGAVTPTAAAASAARPEDRPKLADLLVEVVRAAGRPVTVAQLAEEVVRRKFRTVSRDIPNLISVRIKELVKKGILRRPSGQRGILVGKASSGTKAAAPRSKADGRPQRAASTKAATVKRAAARAKRVSRPGQPSLRAVLAELLKKDRRPQAARELAEQALAAGYQTKSKNLTDAVWNALGQMDGVENVPGKGYRLKNS